MLASTVLPLPPTPTICYRLFQALATVCVIYPAERGSPSQAEMLLNNSPCDGGAVGYGLTRRDRGSPLLTKVILIPAVSVAASSGDGDGVEFAGLSLTWEERRERS